MSSIGLMRRLPALRHTEMLPTPRTIFRAEPMTSAMTALEVALAPAPCPVNITRPTRAPSTWTALYAPPIFARVVEVPAGRPGDALAVDLLRLDGGVEGQRGEDSHLVASVVAFDVVGRVR